VDIACQNGHYKVLNYLIKNDADFTNVKIDTTEENTISIKYCNRLDISLRCKKGETILYEDYNKWILIYIDILKKELDLSYLINLGIICTYTDRSGRTLLHVAVNLAYSEAVDELLKQGMSINARDDKGFTPLHYGSCIGNKEIVQQLIKAGADVNAVSNRGTTPLHLAVKKGHIWIAKILITSNAHVYVNDHKNRFPVEYAKSDKMVRFLKNRRVCFYCGKKGSKQKIKMCSGCMHTHYCSKGCQRGDWLQHKTKCSVSK
jgi:ankyrin repeat protein